MSLNHAQGQLLWTPRSLPVLQSRTFPSPHLSLPSLSTIKEEKKSAQSWTAKRNEKQRLQESEFSFRPCLSGCSSWLCHLDTLWLSKGLPFLVPQFLPNEKKDVIIRNTIKDVGLFHDLICSQSLYISSGCTIINEYYLVCSHSRVNILYFSTHIKTMASFSCSNLLHSFLKDRESWKGSWQACTLSIVFHCLLEYYPNYAICASHIPVVAK